MVDSSAYFYLDSISISSAFKRNPDFGGSLEFVYDSARGANGYKFDSVESGAVIINFQSFVDRLAQKRIHLKSDSTVFITNRDIPVFYKGDVNQLNFADLLAGEKICISMQSNGCFHHFKEKMIIKRQEDNYLIDFYSTRNADKPGENIQTSRKLYPGFKDSLTSFQSSLIEFARKNLLGLCTTSSSYFVQKGDTVFTVHDGTCDGEINYFKLLSVVKPEWFIKDSDY